MKTENTPSQTEISSGEVIDLDARFGSLSRGSCWGKCFVGKNRPIGDFEWVEKNGGTLYLQKHGYYIVGSSDGFNRKARGEFVLKEAAKKS